MSVSVFGLDTEHFSSLIYAFFHTLRYGNRSVSNTTVFRFTLFIPNSTTLQIALLVFTTDLQLEISDSFGF